MRHLSIIILTFISNFALMVSAETITPESAAEWLKDGKWTNGWDVAPDASVNAVEFAIQYERNKDLWDAMFRFLADTDLKTIGVGKHDIVPGRCWAIISEYVPKTAEQMKIESHKKFIDLQYIIEGKEKMGLAKDVTPRIEYNPEREVAFWHSDNVAYHKAGPESFFLFFPSDYHQPSVRVGNETTPSKKVVIKIEYAE